MIKIPDKYRDLLDRPILVLLATLMHDGSPQVQLVWCSFDGTHIRVNTEKSRQKYRRAKLIAVAVMITFGLLAGCAVPVSERSVTA